MFPLYFDENLQDHVLLGMLRRSDVDCLTSNEANNGRRPDGEQLDFAAAPGRLIVTLDRGDFQRLHAQAMRVGREHAGMVLVTSAHISATVIHQRIMRLQAERSPEQMRNAILFLGPTLSQENT